MQVPNLNRIKSSAKSIPSLALVARVAGVARSTASMALRGDERIAPTTRDRVRQLANQLGYHQHLNVDARRMAARRSGRPLPADTIGFLWGVEGGPISRTSFFQRLLEGMLAACWEKRLMLGLLNFDSRQPEMLTTLAQADAVVMPHSAASVLGAVKQLGKPIVAFFQDDPTLATIGIDERDAVTLAYRHLWEHGHRSIGYLGAPIQLGTAARRWTAYCACVKESGRPYDDAHVVLVQGLAGYDLAGADCLRQLWTRPTHPTAVIVYNDLMALGVLQAARELGVRVPAELSVVSIDDIPEAAAATPGLTTVSIDIEGMGRTAVLLAEEFARTATYRAGQTHSKVTLKERASVARIGG
jgi:DNA-binding LacI/PurR family transcriptional regulator